MRGKVARILRKMTDFDPHKPRKYMQLKNEVDIGGQKISTGGGQIFETTIDEHGNETIVTNRSIYRISKKKYVREK